MNRQKTDDISGSTALFGLVLATLAATALRFIGGGDQLWYDEIRTLVGSIREPLGVMLTHFPSNNDHVLYSILSHISVAIGGESPFTVRLPAILLGIASVPALYLMGIRVTTRFEALAASILATVAAQHIWFSQNARGYTLLLVVTLLGTQLIIDGLKTRSQKPWGVFAIACALGAYTHLTMVLAVIGQAIAVAGHLLVAKRLHWDDWKGPIIGFVGAAVLTVLFYLPMIGDVAAFFGDPDTSPKAATAGWAILELFRNLQFGQGSLMLLVGGSIFVIGLASYWRQSPFIVALFFLPAAMVYFTAVLLGRPTFPRFFFFVAGFILLVGVRGVFTIDGFVLRRLGPRFSALERPVQWAAIAAMTGVLLFDLSRTYLKPKMDYDSALAYIDASKRPGDIVALGENGVNYTYTEYYGRKWPLLTGPDHLAELRKSNDVLVPWTFERYLKTRDEALLHVLKTSCVEERNFGGTLADGDIHVSRCAQRP